VTVTFQEEAFSSLISELPELWNRHWDEVALDKEAVPLAPDWMGYKELERLGMLHIMTARADGKLIGYYFAFVRPHLHYRHTQHAWSDIFIILPEYRKGLTGYRLFVETEKMLKSLGVRKSYVVTKVHIPLKMLMKRLGYRFIERVYSKLL
jgi:hypothetical protein